MSVDAQFFFFFEKQLEVLLIILSQQFFFLLFSSFFLTKNNSNIGTRTCQYCSSTCILYRIHTAAFYSKYRLKPRFDHGKKKHMYKPFQSPPPPRPPPYPPPPFWNVSSTYEKKKIFWFFWCQHFPWKALSLCVPLWKNIVTLDHLAIISAIQHSYNMTSSPLSRIATMVKGIKRLCFLPASSFFLISCFTFHLKWKIKVVLLLD